MGDELAQLEALVESLQANVKTLQGRVHYLEELVDTYLHSNVLKRIGFWARGWPADRIASEPGPPIWERPWRRKST